MPLGEALREDARAGRRYDVLGCCDVLVYFGDLGPFFAAAAAAARVDCALALTLEDVLPGGPDDYHVSLSGRFRHAPAFCVRAAEARGWALASKRAEAPRTNAGAPVRGHVYLFRRLAS